MQRDNNNVPFPTIGEHVDIFPTPFLVGYRCPILSCIEKDPTCQSIGGGTPICAVGNVEKMRIKYKRFI
jgi:hypothetical protein